MLFLPDTLAPFTHQAPFVLCCLLCARGLRIWLSFYFLLKILLGFFFFFFEGGGAVNFLTQSHQFLLSAPIEVLNTEALGCWEIFRKSQCGLHTSMPPAHRVNARPPGRSHGRRWWLSATQPCRQGSALVSPHPPRAALQGLLFI